MAPAGGHPLLQVSSPLLRDVTPTPDLLSKLNDMNAAFSFARAFVTGDTVCIAMELFAEELTAEQISYACGLITFAADHWDDELKEAFGGQTFFEGTGSSDGPDAAFAGSEPEEGDDPASNLGGYL